MARLIYAINCSLDGYINDAHGEFDWATPDEELHDYFCDLTRDSALLLYGRRMHETMRVWEEMRGAAGLPRAMLDYAEAWCETDKVVYSTTLTEPGIPRTRIVPRFDPEEVRALKDATDGVLGIAGATLAAEALRAGLVDEIQLAIAPAIVGGGTRALPEGVRLDLAPVDVRRFPSGSLLVTYAVASP